MARCSFHWKLCQDTRGLHSQCHTPGGKVRCGATEVSHDTPIRPRCAKGKHKRYVRPNFAKQMNSIVVKYLEESWLLGLKNWATAQMYRIRLQEKNLLWAEARWGPAWGQKQLHSVLLTFEYWCVLFNSTRNVLYILRYRKITFQANYVWNTLLFQKFLGLSKYKIIASLHTDLLGRERCILHTRLCCCWLWDHRIFTL